MTDGYAFFAWVTAVVACIVIGCLAYCCGHAEGRLYDQEFGRKTSESNDEERDSTEALAAVGE